MKKNLLLVFGLIVISELNAQNLVSSFHSPLPLRAGYIEVLKIQPDGNILVGGNIDYYENQKVHNLIRIHPDGSIDNTFSFLHNDNFLVADIELLPGGEIVILMHGYEGYNDILKGNDKIITLKSDGTIKKEIDAPFESKALAVQADGKIVLAAAQNLRRYTSDLTDDTIFNNALSFNGSLATVDVFENHLFVAGSFSTVNGIAKNDVVKLTLDGSIDNTFDIGANAGTNDYIHALTIQPDGKILFSATINYVNKIIRLNADGSTDTSFSGPSIEVLSKIEVTSDGIYGSGFFQPTTDDFNYRFFKLNLDGSFASDFESVHTQPFDVFSFPIAVSDNGILIGSKSDDGNQFGLAKVDFSGNYIKNFTPEISRIGVARFGQLLEGKLLIGGDFIRVDGYKTYGLARINYDGSVDESFQFKENRGVIIQMEVLENNTVLVSAPNVFFKTNNQGDIMSDFNWVRGVNNLYQVDKFKVLNNSTIIAADPNVIVRLLPDGSVDNTFKPVNHDGRTSTAFDFDIQGEKIICGSIFSGIGGVAENKMARILNDGSIDNTFNIGSGINDQTGNDFVGLIKVLNNNEILVGGGFKSFNGVNLNRSLVKLSFDGTIDMSFNQNQLLSDGIGGATFLYNTVLQIGSVIYISGVDFMYVINVNGSDADFTFPGEIHYVNNIVSSSSSIEGRAQDNENYLYTIGSFETFTTGSPSAILKMTLNQNSTSSNPSSPSIPSTPSVVTETEKSLDASIKIYPQPVADFLTVNTSSGNFHTEVYDISGKKYSENNFSVNTGSFLIDMQNATPGLYLLKITSASGESTVKKFLKKP